MYAADKDNPWMRDVREARLHLPAWAAAIAAAVYSAAVLKVFQVYGVGLEIYVTGAVKDFPGVWATCTAYAILQCLVFGCFLLAALAILAIERRSPWGSGEGGSAAVLLGLIIGAGGISASVALAAMAGAIAPGPVTGSPVGLMLFGLVLVLFQSLSEELFFRGWLQPILCNAWGAWPGVILTSALFALLHFIAGAQSAFAVANVFLGGMLFGVLALRTGNLMAAAAAHFAWNWTEAGVLGLTGDSTPTGSLIHLGFKGAPLWNGGTDTMNGSLATTLVLVALGAAAILMGPRTSSQRPVTVS